MCTKHSLARSGFIASLMRVEGLAEREGGIESLAKIIVGSQLGGFATELDELMHAVEHELAGEKSVIRVDMLVPEVGFETFGTLFIKADGAMTATNGKKEMSQMDTYRIPVVLDVAAIKDPETFVAEMRVEIDSLFASGKRELDSVR